MIRTINNNNNNNNNDNSGDQYLMNYFLNQAMTLVLAGACTPWLKLRAIGKMLSRGKSCPCCWGQSTAVWHGLFCWHLPSGKLSHSYGNSPSLIGKSTINGPFSIAMSAITRGYVKSQGPPMPSLFIMDAFILYTWQWTKPDFLYYYP